MPSKNKGKETWLRQIQKSQRQISSSPGTNKYYMKAYRDSEISYWSHIPKWIIQYKKDNPNIKNCLDIGGAYGTLALFCRNVFGCNVYITDFLDVFSSKPLLKENNIVFAVNNIETEKFPWDIKFDIIILTEVLEHFNLHPVPTLKKIHSLLSENGRLFLSTPDSAKWGVVTKYYNSLADIPLTKDADQKVIDDHVWQYSRPELLSVLDESGFYVEKIDYSPGTIGRHFNLSLSKRPCVSTDEQVKTQLYTKSEIINFLRDEVMSKTRKASKLQDDLKLVNDTVSKLQDDLKLANNTVSKLQDDLKLANDTTRKLQMSSNLVIQEKSGLLTSLKNNRDQIDRMTGQINEQRTEIQTIKDSVSFRLAKTYGRRFGSVPGSKLFERFLGYLVRTK